MHLKELQGLVQSLWEKLASGCGAGKGATLSSAACLQDSVLGAPPLPLLRAGACPGAWMRAQHRALPTQRLRLAIHLQEPILQLPAPTADSVQLQSWRVGRQAAPPRLRATGHTPAPRGLRGACGEESSRGARERGALPSVPWPRRHSPPPG